MSTPTIEHALRTVLLSSTGIAALVSTRIHPHAAAQGSSLPLAIYQRISAGHFHHINPESRNVSGMAHARIQYDWYSDSHSEAGDLAELARLALDGYGGVVAVSGLGNITVESVWLDDDAEEYEEPKGDEGVGIWRFRQDWIATWLESSPST